MVGIASSGYAETVSGFVGLADTIPPSIAVVELSSPDRTFLKTGDEVSVKLDIGGTALIPTVTLFNGAVSATSGQLSSPYTFTYVIDNENGPIVYQVKAVDQAGNTAEATITHPGRVAGRGIHAFMVLLDAH